MQRRRSLLAAVAASAVCVAASIGGAASAQTNSGTTNGTFTLSGTQLRSIVVTPATVTADSCYTNFNAWFNNGNPPPAPSGTTMGPLGFCLTQAVTITNGPVGGHIWVGGTNAAGTNGTGTWTLQTGAPTQDTYTLGTFIPAKIITGAGGQTFLLPEHGFNMTTSAACDTTYDASAGTAPVNAPDCAATANQAVTEYLGTQGAQTSTGTATIFGFSATWTAVS
jgi:hypothetical protein